MLKKFWILLTLALLMVSSTWYFWPISREVRAEKTDKGSGQGQSSKIDVGFIEVQPSVINRTTALPGRVVPFKVAEIRPQVSGIIQSRLFKEGSYVKEGQQLYQIDPARYKADVQMAEASLQDARARMRNAQNLVKRFEKLIDYNAVSQQEYDDARASLDQAKAAVALAEAEIANAQINLDYTKVYAPISGYIGPSNVTKGALVTAQQELALAVVRQLDPVYVDLSQSAAEAKNLQARLTASRLNEAKTTYDVHLVLGNTEQNYPYKGELDATDLAVDTQTGAIRLRSVFSNPDNILLPGMFVRATVADAGRNKAIIVPQKSVRIEPDGTKTVWVIVDENSVTKRPIRTGATYHNNWVVLNGLEQGDRVVVEGGMMLRSGAAVRPQEMALEDISPSQNLPRKYQNNMPTPEENGKASGEEQER